MYELAPASEKCLWNNGTRFFNRAQRPSHKNYHSIQPRTDSPAGADSYKSKTPPVHPEREAQAVEGTSHISHLTSHISHLTSCIQYSNTCFKVFTFNYKKGTTYAVCLTRHKKLTPYC